MNRLDLLIKKWKAGSIRDPDLSLCLSYINNIQLEKLHERKPESPEGINPVLGEDNNPNPKRSKTKRL